MEDRRIIAVAVWALLGLASSAAASAPPHSTVVVLVIEALRHDYPERIEAPVFDRLEAEGARAGRLIPVFPPNSLPGQAAIATGRLPGGSGVVNNRFYDRRLRLKLEGKPADFGVMLEAEPIWAAAARAGIQVGTIHWMVGPRRDLLRTSRLSNSARDEDRIAELEEWIEDSGAAAPRLLLVYLEGLDQIAHTRGPDAAETLRAARGYAVLAGRVLDALERHRGASATLFVLGDHGMTTVHRCVYLKAFLRSKGIAAEPFATGGSANLYLKNPSDARRARAALDREAELMKVYLPDQLPADYGYRDPNRVGDLVLIGAPGVYFRDLGDRPFGPPRTPGVHGFAPEQPDMAGAFFAWGRGVPAGTRWPQVKIVDLYPTLCELLGIGAAAGIDGRTLPGIGVEPAAPETR
jgi:predicted AlkP superfamily pyrophosphatase or phosphodiesterase